MKYIPLTELYISKWKTHAIRYADGTLTSVVTLVIIRYIHPTKHGHTQFKHMVVIDQLRGHGHIVSRVSNWFASFSFYINQNNNS